MTTLRWLRRAGLTGLAVALMAGGLAAPAHADERTLDTDGVKVDAVGFDFGDGSYQSNEMSQTGPVEWLVDENDLTPHLTGILHLAGVNNECARMRIDYYTSATTFLTTRYGGTVCAPDNGYNAWSVNLRPYTSNKIGKVKVSIEVQLPDGTYDIVGSDWSTLHTFIDTTVKVADSDGSGVWGIGFGSSGWSNGSPIGYGQIVWNLDGGQIRPHLSGNLHMESAAGDCVRMRIDYYSDDGPDAGTASDYITTVYGGTVCALDNSHHEWTVDRDDYSGTDIRHVRVSIEEQVTATTWTIIDSTYSYFGS
ncbi:hypothetical protein [Allorhizocola rhizosphaerae]|uniref:hypothetical protein n=1 Tax=Allorhizocola rhizosphaerae TaxID=1872709 RepID=UPI000E3EB90B|nr:hypothetical protein [Allorhizocola rhizosphaerae]